VERVSQLLTQGGVYLARLDPAKHMEIGKIRPVVILTGQFILDIQPLSIFVCPLSSKSYEECSNLHVQLPPRDKLQKTSFALIEHCCSIATQRLVEKRIAQLTTHELELIFTRISYMCNI
jgi:mRNA interferase MazF